MKSILKILLIFFAAFVVKAGVEDPFEQLSSWQFVDLRGDGDYTKVFTLNAPAGKVYLTNWVQNWNNVIPLDAVFNMTKYGYIDAAKIGENPNLAWSDYESYITWSNKSTTDVTYYDDANPDTKVTAKAYLLDEFEEETEVYIVMHTTGIDTPHEYIDSYQKVDGQEGTDDTILAARKAGENDDNNHNSINADLVNAPSTKIRDLAGNFIVNFGLTNGGQREFVAIYEKPTYVSGHPLPVGFIANFLAIGTVVVGSITSKKRRY